MKTCTKCGIKKSNFGKDKRATDGLQSQCSECKNQGIFKYRKASDWANKAYKKKLIKICSKCGVKNPICGFGKDRRASDGLESECKECKSKRNIEYEKTPRCKEKRQRRDKVKRSECSKRHYQNNIDRYRKCNEMRYNKNKEEISEKRKITNKLLKFEVMSHYSIIIGVPICAHKYCQITDIDMLCIDHINNNGNKHRKEEGITGGVKLYKWLIDNNYPTEFQVLCWNHNMKKYMELINK